MIILSSQVERDWYRALRRKTVGLFRQFPKVWRKNWRRSILVVSALITISLYWNACQEPVIPDTEPPVVTLSNPHDGATVYDEVTIQALASDNQSIFRVDFYIDNQVYSGSFVQGSVFQYKWNTTGSADFSVHTIFAKAYDNGGNSAFSDTITCIVNNQGRPPLPVTLLPASKVTKHSIDLAWTASIDREFEAYRLYRNISNSWDETATLVAEIRSQTTTTFSDIGRNADNSMVTPFGLAENQTYYYRLTVVDTVGHVAQSNVISATTKLPTPVVLKSNYQATKDKITISWYSSSEDVRYYRIHRARHSGVGTSLEDSVGVVSPNQTTFQDTGLSAITSYYYRVFVVDEAGYASGSNIIRAETTDLPALHLEEPLPADIGKSWVKLRWSRSREEDRVVYRLYRAQHPAVSSFDLLIATVTNRIDTVFLDQSVSPSQKYYYVVYHYDSRGNEKASNEINLTTLGMSSIPLAAINIGKYSATLRWSQYPETDFSVYKIYRGTYFDFDTATATLKRFITNRSTVTFTDNDLSRESVYYYRLFVCDRNGYEAGSQVGLNTRNIEAVEIKKVEKISDQQYRVTFTRNQLDQDFDHYAIYRDMNASVDQSDQLIGTVTTCTDTVFNDTYQLVAGQKYYYRVYVYDKSGNVSAGSNIPNDAANNAPQASNLSFSRADYFSVTLTWSPNSESDFQRYELYRSKQSNFTKDTPRVTKIATFYSRNSTTYTDNNLASGSRYYYRLYTYDTGGKYSASQIVYGYTTP